MYTAAENGQPLKLARAKLVITLVAINLTSGDNWRALKSWISMAILALSDAKVRQ